MNNLPEIPTDLLAQHTIDLIEQNIEKMESLISIENMGFVGKKKMSDLLLLSEPIPINQINAIVNIFKKQLEMTQALKDDITFIRNIDDDEPLINSDLAISLGCRLQTIERILLFQINSLETNP